MRLICRYHQNRTELNGRKRVIIARFLASEVLVVSATQKLFRFGGFELNLESEELSKSGIAVKLPPQPLKLLALLAGHASQVVTRDQILILVRCQADRA
jgi:DNA-binding response OmpR family regulator